MPLIRLAEWKKKSASSEWTREARDAIAELARSWQSAHGLNAPPLEWSGSDGQTLAARQWVGVVEWGEFRVEIYPKLDQFLLANSDAEISEVVADSSLRALLAMLEAADYGEWIDNGRASLEYEPLQFADVWAYLLGKNLAPLLRDGLTHAYVAMSDDLPAVRGKIAVSRQISHRFNRADVIACVWDEWSSDNALNRLLKCALAFLQKRVSHSRSRAVLGDCLWLLDEAQSVSPREALAQTERFAFSRATKRFENAFELSRRILASQSPDFGARDAQSWVFLTDMNKLFEKFCGRALEAQFGDVEAQNPIGTLFLDGAQRIAQKPDFLWHEGGKLQVGDAKWKLLGQTANGAAPFDISADDARQMTVYSEILKRRENLEFAPEMTIFYPVLDEKTALQTRRAWNGANLRLCGVRVKNFENLGAVLSLK